MDDISASSAIAVSGMKAQARRLRVVSENMANIDSLSKYPGGDPYRRKMVIFRNVLDREVGADIVETRRDNDDKTPFNLEYDPSHPAADAAGYLKTPNVNMLIELMDMREAQRSYEANLNVISASKEIMSKTIDLIR